MAGLQFVVQGTADEALSAIEETARTSGFTVSVDAEGRLVARRGSFGLSILLGAFIAYCDFKFAAAPEGKDAVRVTMTRNNPWWTGLIGISRVKKAAGRLVDDIEKSLGPRFQNRTEVK
jgi:hypothetical protein